MNYHVIKEHNFLLNTIMSKYVEELVIEKIQTFKKVIT